MIFDGEKFLVTAPIASILVALVLWHGEGKKNRKLAALSDKIMQQNVLSNVNFVGQTLKTLIYLAAPVLYSLILSGMRTNCLPTLIAVLAVEPLIPLRKRAFTWKKNKKKKDLYK
jgi:hypothetical protein